jgi:hypothetical protein
VITPDDDVVWEKPLIMAETGRLLDTGQPMMEVVMEVMGVPTPRRSV